MTEATCDHCGRSFVAWQARWRFCSQDCQLAALRERRLSRVRVCDGCGVEFRSATLATRFCSLACAHRHKSAPAPRPCVDCGAEVRNTSYRPLCAECGKERQKEIWRRKNRKRRGDDITREPYTLAEIARRDGYRCGLCRGKVDMTIAYPHLDSPTIDHIIPLSISRDDTRTNVQLAHRGCNNSKSNRGSGEQLMLIG